MVSAEDPARDSQTAVRLAQKRRHGQSCKSLTPHRRTPRRLAAHKQIIFEQVVGVIRLQRLGLGQDVQEEGMKRH
jgi:hypothetical protein